MLGVPHAEREEYSAPVFLAVPLINLGASHHTPLTIEVNHEKT